METQKSAEEDCLSEEDEEDCLSEENLESHGIPSSAVMDEEDNES